MSRQTSKRDVNLHGIVVWSIIMPFCGIVVGFFVGQALLPGSEILLMVIGFFGGEYLAIRLGKKPGAYKVFLFTLLGGLIGGIAGAILGTILGMFILNRKVLAPRLKSFLFRKHTD